MEGKTDLYKTVVDKDFLWITFDREKETNPFSRKLSQSLIEILPKIEDDPKIRGLVLTGGIGRSFSTGGDFNDVSRLQEREEVSVYLNEIIDLYQAILRVTKPVLAVIDHYAIGQGLQVAMMTDWRIATKRAKVSMPELKNGVACPLGALILEVFFGRGSMLKDVIGCGTLTTEDSRIHKYFDEVISEAEVKSAATSWTLRISEYPEVPYRLTKKIHNQRLIDALEEIRVPAAEAHIQSILARTGQAHFQKILSRNIKT